MKRATRLLVPILAVLALILPGPALAGGPTGPNYRIRRGTYAAAAGGVGTSPGYTLRGTLGQSSVSLSRGITRTASGGIWYGHTAANILVLEKEYRDGTPPAVEAGDEIVYVVAVTNNGYRTQERVVVTDTIPAELSLVPGSVEADTGTTSVDGDTITLQIPTLTYEQIAILTYRVLVEQSAEGQTITNTAFAASDAYGPISRSAAFHVHGPFRIFLPLAMRSYPPLPSGPEVHELQDAPDACPGHNVEVGDHLYRDDWDVPNDNDWFSFQAVAGQIYTIQTSELEARADTMMTLYASDCTTELAQNDDVNWPGDVSSRIVWTAPVNGTYCVMLRSYDWQVYGNDTGYTFDVALCEPQANASSSPEPMPGAPVKPPPPPTPAPDGASARPPGKASLLPQKPPPPPTPQKSPPAPTPGPASPPSAPSGGESQSQEVAQEPAPVILLPETGGPAGWWPALATGIGGLILVVGLWVLRRRTGDEQRNDRTETGITAAHISGGQNRNEP